MNEAQKIEEWARFYNASPLKFVALKAILVNDGAQMLEAVLKKLKLKTASDVVKECDDN